jgi:hypothetical protein
MGIPKVYYQFGSSAITDQTLYVSCRYLQRLKLTKPNNQSMNFWGKQVTASSLLLRIDT